MIEFEKVCVKEKEKLILEEITFTVEEMGKTAIYGKSGSGKSTVLTTILGVYKPCRGRVLFDGEEVNIQTIQKVREQVSYIGQEPFMGAETVKEALYLPFTFKANQKNKPDDETVAKTLHLLQLDESIIKQDSAVISGGEKQRIAIARALLQGKRVFVLDEITSALDPESKRAVLDLFTDSQFTFLSVSHDSAWYDICQKFIQLEEGRIVYQGIKPKAIPIS